MILPLVLLGIAGIVAWESTRPKTLAVAPLPSSVVGPPVLTGLVPGTWYSVMFRSTLDQRVFGDAALLQSQTFLGRQGYGVRDVTPDPNDPFVYHAKGIFNGIDGSTSLADSTGIILIGSAPTDPLPDVTRAQHIDQRPVDLEPGKVYFGRAAIGFPLSMLVSSAKIQSAMQNKGFTDVIVVDDASKLPADWPSNERGGDYFVQATYAGTPTTFDVPGQVSSIWEMVNV